MGMLKLYYLGGFPSNLLLPSICIWTFTRSVGLAINWPKAPAVRPPNEDFLQQQVIEIRSRITFLTWLYKKKMYTSFLPNANLCAF
jgi:hypothetical protein